VTGTRAGVGAAVGARRALGVLARVAGCAAMACALVAPIASVAGEPPGMGRKVTLMAREQPLAAFLQELFAGVDVPVSVSAAAQGVVNGRFDGSVQSVFRDVARSFSLSGYYDGAAMHLYPASEIGTRTYATDPTQAARIQRTASELSLPDARNTLRATQGGTLVAIGGPRFLQQMDDLVRADGARAQAPVATPAVRVAPAAAAGLATPAIGFRVFYLKHAWAQDTRLAFGGRQVVIPGVASVLRSITAGLGQTVAQPLPPGAGLLAPNDAPAAASDRLLPPVQPKLKGSGLAGTGQPDGRMPTLGDPADEALAPGRARQQAGLPSSVSIGVDGMPVLQRYVVNQVGAVRIEADTRSNAVVVRDVVERLPMYDELIASLDVPPQMIEVEATIVDVNITRLEQLGINWRWINGRNEVLFGNGTVSDTLLNPGRQITPSGAGLFVSTVLGDSFNFISRINALSTDGAARVVSRPQLVTLSNVEALFDSSSTFYVRVAGREEVDLFNVSAGTALRVTPNVFQDTDGVRIKLMVSVEDGRISSEKVDQIPVVDRSTINTQALMLEGESLLIGGMTRDGSDRKVDKVPFLGDLPAVGALFRSKADSNSRIERLILITPRLIDSRRTLASVGAQRAQDAAPQRATPTGPGAPQAVPAGVAAVVPSGALPAAARPVVAAPAAVAPVVAAPVVAAPVVAAPVVAAPMTAAPMAPPRPVAAPASMPPAAVRVAAVPSAASPPVTAMPVPVAPASAAPVTASPAVSVPVPVAAAAGAAAASPSDAVSVVPAVTQSWSGSRRVGAAPSGCVAPGGDGRC
jgi:type III secretion protein C